MHLVTGLRSAETLGLLMLFEASYGASVVHRGWAMRITVANTEGVTLLKVSGEVDVRVAGELREVGLAALTPATELLVIDLANVTFIDSTGLSALINIRNAADDHCEVMIDNPQPRVMRVLQITGLDQLLGGLERAEPDESCG